jgi:D-sedoheptulose 7-phosphate isomerase
MDSISNDYGFSHVFGRQVEALAQKDGLVIDISTGGTSPNEVALVTENALSSKIRGLNGKDGGNYNALCDVNLLVNPFGASRIQEVHILYGHTICHLIELQSNKSK